MTAPSQENYERGLKMIFDVETTGNQQKYDEAVKFCVENGLLEDDGTRRARLMLQEEEPALKYLPLCEFLRRIFLRVGDEIRNREEEK